MALVTRCAHAGCGTLFRVSVVQLQAHGGQVRCGQCGHVFDAFPTLTTVPDATLRPAGAEAPPISASVAPPSAVSPLPPGDATALREVEGGQERGRDEEEPTPPARESGGGARAARAPEAARTDSPLAPVARADSPPSDTGPAGAERPAPASPTWSGALAPADSAGPARDATPDPALASAAEAGGAGYLRDLAPPPGDAAPLPEDPAADRSRERADARPSLGGSDRARAGDPATGAAIGSLDDTGAPRAEREAGLSAAAGTAALAPGAEMPDPAQPRAGAVVPDTLSAPAAPRAEDGTDRAASDRVAGVAPGQDLARARPGLSVRGVLFAALALLAALLAAWALTDDLPGPLAERLPAQPPLAVTLALAAVAAGLLLRLVHRHAATWWVVVALLSIALALQAALAWRAEIAASHPALRPVLEAICSMGGCRVGLPRESRDLAIESSDLLALDAKRPQLIQLVATIRNRGDRRVALPAIELTLSDAQERPLARRVLLPAQYLARGVDPEAGVRPGEEFSIRLTLDTTDLRPVGYRLYLFHP